jgi:hypothetical protein
VKLHDRWSEPKYLCKICHLAIHVPNATHDACKPSSAINHHGQMLLALTKLEHKTRKSLDARVTVWRKHMGKAKLAAMFPDMYKRIYGSEPLPVVDERRDPMTGRFRTK